MNTHHTLLFAAVIAGGYGAAIAVMWLLTGTNQGDKVRHQCFGSAVSAFSLGFIFLIIAQLFSP